MRRQGRGFSVAEVGQISRRQRLKEVAVEMEAASKYWTQKGRGGSTKEMSDVLKAQVISESRFTAVPSLNWPILVTPMLSLMSSI